MDEKAKLKKEYIRLAVRIVTIALIFFIIFTFFFMIAQMHGTDMYPSIKDGDLIFGYRLQKKYEVGDIVAFTENGKTLVGRVAAAGGDVIELNQAGGVYVNGTAQSGEIIFPTYPKESIKFPYKVPENSVFILCDYRTNCVDSRNFGAVDTDDIKCKVITLLRRRAL